MEGVAVSGYFHINHLRNFIRDKDCYGKTEETREMMNMKKNKRISLSIRLLGLVFAVGDLLVGLIFGWTYDKRLRDKDLYVIRMMLRRTD